MNLYKSLEFFVIYNISYVINLCVKYILNYCSGRKKQVNIPRKDVRKNFGRSVYRKSFPVLPKSEFDGAISV